MSVGINCRFFFPPSEAGGLLFVGFNPSFPNELKNRQWKHSYDIGTVNTIDVDQLIKQEIETQDILPYFKILKEIADKVHLPWSHIDVFMLRETSQDKAKQKVFQANTNNFNMSVRNSLTFSPRHYGYRLQK